MAPANGGVLGRDQTFLCARVVREISTFAGRLAFGVCVRGEAGRARLGQVVAGAALPSVGRGLGCFLGNAVALRSAASISIAFFGPRRASEAAALDLSEACVDLTTGGVDINVRCEENDQFGGRRLAHIVSLPLRECACPVRLLSGWMRLRKWLPDHREKARRLAGVEGRGPLFVRLAPARFGRGMAAAGMSASRKRYWGVEVSPLAKKVPGCT